MRYTIFCLFVAISLRLSLSAKSQETTTVYLGMPIALSVGTAFPNSLLSNRTAVIVSPQQISNDIYGRSKDWKSLAKSAHKSFQKSGIDAMAYYNIHDLTAGSLAKRAFFEMMKKRQIENLVFLNQLGDNDYQVVITTFNKAPSIITSNQPAVLYDGSNLDLILTSLYRTISASTLAKENFLIPDNPEFFNDIHLNTNRRYVEFAADLKLDKLAVPSFTSIPLPKNLSSRSRDQFVKYNIQMRKDSIELIQIMSEYPFQYAFFEPNDDDQIYRNLGYQFVLLHLKSEGQSIKRMLNYKTGITETDYISVGYNGKSHLKTVPINAPVTKFYVKHISSRDLYLGNDWDADLTWQQALRNFIRGLKKQMKIQ